MLHRSTVFALFAAALAITQVGEAQEPLPGRVQVLPASKPEAPPMETRSEEEIWGFHSVSKDPDAALKYWDTNRVRGAASMASLAYLWKIAYTYMYGGFEADAIETFLLLEAEARSVPASSRAGPRFDLAMCLHWFGRTEEALELLSQVLQEYPDTSFRSSILVNTANYYSELGHFDQADALFAQCFQEDGDDYRGSRLIGHWTRLGMWQEALGYWEQFNGASGGCASDGGWLARKKLHWTLRCLFELGRFGDVVERSSSSVFEVNARGFEREIASTLIAVHRELGSLDAFMSEVEQPEARGSLAMAVLGISRVRRLAAFGDKDGLCRLLLNADRGGRLGAAYSAVTRVAFEALLEDSWMAGAAAKRCHGYELNLWITTLLAAVRDPLALFRIDQAVQEEPDETLEARLYGLALLGTPAAYGLLHRLLEHERPAVRKAADHILRRHPEGHPVEGLPRRYLRSFGKS